MWVGTTPSILICYSGCDWDLARAMTSYVLIWSSNLEGVGTIGDPRVQGATMTNVTEIFVE
jgi:hypothetical protein